MAVTGSGPRIPFGIHPPRFDGTAGFVCDPGWYEWILAFAEMAILSPA